MNTSAWKQTTFYKTLKAAVPESLRPALAETARARLPIYRPMTIFDVGANDGRTFLPTAKLLPWIKVFAFEPTPQLCGKIESAAKGLRNYTLVPKAVGEVPGFAQFNVSGIADWGCSSLLPFNDNLRETWPGRTDFQVTETIPVEVIRLDEYLRNSPVTVIDFLHVDVQGMDLSVLRSMGAEISRVRRGVIEVPSSVDVKLYKGQPSREEAESFLHEKGFVVHRISAQQNELNLYFKARGSLPEG